MSLKLSPTVVAGLVIVALSLALGFASHAEVIKYVYDDLNCLIRVEYGGTAIEYIYDEVGNRTQKASSDIVQYALTVSKTGTGKGIVTTSPVAAGINCGTDCTERFNQGTEVTLTVVPGPGSVFLGWSGGGCTGAGNCTFALNADTSVTALLDYTAPEGSVIINEGAETTDNPVLHLSLSAADPDGVAEMQLSNDGANWAAPEAYATRRDWVLSAMFFDDFRTDSTGQYAVANGDGAGGIFFHDPEGQRGRAVVGEGENSMNISLPLAPLSSGSFGMDFTPTARYGAAGMFWLYLMQDDKNYYRIYNAEGYNPGYVEKYVNGVQVQKVSFTRNYTQGGTYPIKVTYSPSQTTISAFGQTIVLQANNSIITVKKARIGLGRQDAYIDNVRALVSAPVGTKTVYVRYKDTLENWSETYNDSIVYIDVTAPVTTVSPVPGAYTTPQTVRLTCSDGTGSGCDNIYYTLDGSDPADPALTPLVYSSSSPIPVDTSTTIRYFSVDKAGNREQPSKMASYAIDGLAPTGSIVINDDAPATDNTLVHLSLMASDATGTGVAQMQLSNDGTNWSAQEAYQAVKDWRLYDTILDDFSADTTGLYRAVVDAGEGGELVYDWQNQRGEVVIRDGQNAVDIIRDLAPVTSGMFSVDFKPVLHYGTAGMFWLRLIQDESTYYKVYNSDVYTDGRVEKVINGAVVEKINFNAKYVQGTTYPVTVAYSPAETTVTAFGKTITLKVNNTAIMVNKVEMGFGRQPSYIDNIRAMVPPANGNKTVYVKYKDGAGNWSPVYNDSIVLDIIDVTAPVTTVSPVPGAYTTPQTVRLTCSDGTGSGCDNIYYTLDGSDPADPALTPLVYSSSSPIPVDTNATIRFFSVDRFGNREVPNEAYYIIDPTAPSGSITVTGDGTTDIGVVRLNLSASDNNGSGVVQMQLSNDGFSWSDPEPYTQTKVWLLGDTMLDDFITDTTGQYTAIDLDGTAGGQFIYDWPNQRAEVAIVPGENIMAVSRSLPVSPDGSYSVDFTPTSHYGTAGMFWLELMQDDNTYYKVYNSDVYTNGRVEKIVNGIVVESVSFGTKYSSGVTYPIKVTYHPAVLIVEAFGKTITLGSNKDSIAVSKVSMSFGRQNAYLDNLKLIVPPENGNKTVSIKYRDGAGNWSGVISTNILLSRIDAATPVTTAEPERGSYSSAQAVRLTCSDGAGSGCDNIYYTVDGTDPVPTSSVYMPDNPISVPATTIIKFYAVDKRGNVEKIRTAEYVIDTAVPGDLVVDNGSAAAAYTGTWLVSGNIGYYGNKSLSSNSNGSTYSWQPVIARPGIYDVFMWWTENPTNSDNAPVDIADSQGLHRVRINQRMNGGRWNKLGTYIFDAGGSASVTLTAESSYYYNADAVKLVYKGDPFVSISTPDNFHLQGTGDLTVEAVAGGLAAGGVKFILDMNTPGEQVVIDTAAPYRATFSSPARGEHTLDAFAVDNGGNVIAGSFVHDRQEHIGVGTYLVAVGDSITHSYPGEYDDYSLDDVSNDRRSRNGGFEPVLSDMLASTRGYPHVVANEGIGGAKSRDGVSYISGVLSKHPRSEFILLMYGTNDSKADVPSGLGHRSGTAGYTGSYKENMQRIITAVLNAGKTPILAKLPPVYGDCAEPENCGSYSDPHYEPRNALIREYNQVIDELVLENRLIMDGPDFYQYFSAYPEELFDNYHPNGMGYRSMAKLWLNVLASGPAGTVLINEGAGSTRSASVTLSLSCSGASGCSHMSFSNDNNQWTAPEAYNQVKTWTVSAGDGIKTVYAKFSDNAGNWSGVYSDTITLDTAAPVTTASIGEGTYSEPQSIALTANEEAAIHYTTDGSTPTTSSATYASQIYIAETTTLKFFGVDKAGNHEAVKSMEYVIVTTPLPDTQAPSVPAGLTGTAVSASQVDLSWSASTDDVGVAGYRVYRDGSQAPIATVTATSYADTGLTHSTTYAYRVASYDAANNASAPSTEVLVTTQAGNPGEDVSVIRQDCTGYSPSTRCFQSLADWQAYKGNIDFTGCAQGDLTCVSKIAVARIEGTWTNPDTAPVALDGWITSAQYHIKIYTAPESRHQGRWDNTKYRLVVSTAPATEGIIAVAEEYVRIEGLQIFMNFDGKNYAAGVDFSDTASGVKDHRISHCIIKGNTGTIAINKKGINAADDGYLRAWNNIIYDMKGSNSSGIQTKGISYIYNNTVHNCTLGFYVRTGTGTVSKNSIAQDCTDGFYGTFSASSVYNISNLASDAPGVGSKNSTVVTFADKAGDDFHLASSDTAARGAGVNPSDVNLEVTDDIDGTLRPQGTGWDIGADER
ncbi:MAG: chitobiase/beta-hexosaminidase C-terminal domain-containing protein [Nitrospirota bacterium]